MTKMPSLSPAAIAADAVGAAPGDGVRLRLLLLTDTSIMWSGGSERFLRNLVSRLPPDRYQVTVVQLNGATTAWSGLIQPAPGQHVQLLTLPITAAYGLPGWRALWHLRRMVQREHFDIVQSQHEKSDLFNALLPRARGTVQISNRRDMGYNKSSRLRLLSRFLNHRFDCVVAPAQPILSGLARQENIAARQMLWIPNGVDTERFRPQSTQARQRSRRALGLADAEVAFGCVARLYPVKCHDHLLQAFAEAHRRLPHTRLLLIGDGPLRSRIERQIGALGLDAAVVMLRARADVEAILPALDVAVLTSSTEGMSNALLEAMACGLPVVATAVGGNLQLVQHEVSGLLVPVRQPAALADAFVMLAQSMHTRLRMGIAARTRIEHEFSLDSMVHSYDRLYQRLVGRS